MNQKLPTRTHEATIETLAKLRVMLRADDTSEPMQADCKALYNHIEKTLLTALGEYYGEQIKKDT